LKYITPPTAAPITTKMNINFDQRNLLLIAIISVNRNGSLIRDSRAGWQVTRILPRVEGADWVTESGAEMDHQAASDW
jgi:hypothetical protein